MCPWANQGNMSVLRHHGPVIGELEVSMAVDQVIYDTSTFSGRYSIICLRSTLFLACKIINLSYLTNRQQCVMQVAICH